MLSRVAGAASALSSRAAAAAAAAASCASGGLALSGGGSSSAAWGGTAAAALTQCGPVRHKHFVKRRRTQLTGKTGPKGFYKGKGVPSVGRPSKKGVFRVNPAKLPDYTVPDLEGFTLKPYVQRGPAPEELLRPWAAQGSGK